MFRMTVQRKRHVKLPTTVGASGRSKVRVGFPAGAVDGGVIERAVYNHFGTSRGIPERPFLTNAMRDNRGKYRSEMKGSAAKILRGEAKMPIVLSKLGILAQGDIQAEITSLSSPPNAASTIRQKGSSNPLIDTGEMRAAVTFKIDE